VTRQVVTAAGGQVSTANGHFKMQIPPGALKQDTAFTIRVDPPAVGAFGPVYEVGPTGTQFQRSVTLSLSFAGVDFGGGDPNSLHVATLSAGRWVPVTSTTDLVSLIVTGQIPHLSPWTLIVVPPDAGTGGDLDAGVGGDVAAEASGDAPEGGTAGHDGGTDSTGAGGAAGSGGEGGSGQAGTGGAGQGGAGAGGQSGAAGNAGAGGVGGQSGVAGDSGQTGGGGQGGSAGAQDDAASDADTTDADMSDGGVDPDAT
jgi:hypothetical protein